MDSTLKKYMADNQIDDEERFCIRLNWSKFQHWYAIMLKYIQITTI